jgi:hypothetical protein
MIARLAPWLLVAVVSACCLLLIQRASRAVDEREKAAEAQQLIAKHQIVVAQVTNAALVDKYKEVSDGNVELQKAVDEARKAAPKARVVRVVQASTGPVPIDEEAVRTMCAELMPANQSVEAQAELKGEIKVASVDLRTEKGNIIATGAAEAWQVEPEPRRLLFGGRFIAPATTAAELAPPPDTRWPWYTHLAIGLGAGLAAGVYVGSR